MSKDRKMIKEKKKAPNPDAVKKQSSYQSDKNSLSKSDSSITKKK